MASRWRQWVPGPRHGLARGVAVYGVPRPHPEQISGLLGRCDQLRAWTRARGFRLKDTPGDLRLFDLALDEAMGEATSELGGPARVARLGNEVGSRRLTYRPLSP